MEQGRKNLRVEFVQTRSKDEFYQVRDRDGGMKTLPSATTVLKHIPDYGISIKLLKYEETEDTKGTKITAIVEAQRQIDDKVITIPDVVSFYVEDKILNQQLSYAKDFARHLGYRERTKEFDDMVIKILNQEVSDNIKNGVKIRFMEIETRTRMFASRIAMTQAQSRAVQKILSISDWMSDEEREMEIEEIRTVNEEISNKPKDTEITETTKTPEVAKTAEATKTTPRTQTEIYKFSNRDQIRFLNSIQNLKTYYGITDEEVDQFTKEKGYTTLENISEDLRDAFILSFKEFCKKNSRRDKNV